MNGSRAAAALVARTGRPSLPRTSEPSTPSMDSAKTACTLAARSCITISADAASGCSACCREMRPFASSAALKRQSPSLATSLGSVGVSSCELKSTSTTRSNVLDGRGRATLPASAANVLSRLSTGLASSAACSPDCSPGSSGAGSPAAFFACFSSSSAFSMVAWVSVLSSSTRSRRDMVLALVCAAVSSLSVATMIKIASGLVLKAAMWSRANMAYASFDCSSFRLHIISGNLVAWVESMSKR